ncbi:MAG TPA: hypothetical protein VGB97_03345 [Candidatus Paceibacterota bacterium]
MSKQQPDKAFPPNHSLQAFAPVIGEWKTAGTHGMIPDTPLHGHTSFSWHESGAFIVMQSSINEDVGIPHGLAILASDDALGTFAMAYYDERGVSRHYHLSIQDNVVKWWREQPSVSQRYSLTISEDGHTLTGKGEISKDGITWEQDLNLVYSKV